MSNVNNPHGFRPLMRSLSGGPGAAALQVYKMSSYGTALFIGDPVCKVTSGTPLAFPSVSAAITPGTTPVLGVNLQYGAANAQTVHLIIPVDNQIFECQANGTANITSAMLTENANMASGAGSTLTQLSGWVLDSNTVATTNTLDLHILGLFQSAVNALGQYARLEVIFNNSASRPQVAGV